MKTPDRIVRAALTVFGRYGFRRSNMELIATEAGLSRQALYRYAENKEALFVAVVEDLHGAAIEAGETAAAAAIRSDADLAEVVFALLDARFRVFLEHLHGSPHAAELTAENTQLAAATTQAYARKLTESVSRVIRTEVAANALTLRGDLSPDELAYMAIRAARGLKEVHPSPDPTEFGIQLHTMLELLIAGALTPRPPRTRRTTRPPTST